MSSKDHWVGHRSPGSDHDHPHRHLLNDLPPAIAMILILTFVGHR
jgi:hypothetical protein